MPVATCISHVVIQYLVIVGKIYLIKICRHIITHNIWTFPKQAFEALTSGIENHFCTLLIFTYQKLLSVCQTHK